MTTLYLSNPSDGRKVSVDFTVEKDGSIWKLNPDLQKYYCNHAGSSTSWRGFHNAQVNTVTVGIEIAQKGNLTLAPIYSEPQVKLVAQLCAWLNKQYDIKNSDITTHRKIITDGSRSDPRQFPFDIQNGFWHFYWEFLGMGDNFVSSLHNQ